MSSDSFLSNTDVEAVDTMHFESFLTSADADLSLPAAAKPGAGKSTPTNKQINK